MRPFRKALAKLATASPTVGTPTGSPPCTDSAVLVSALIETISELFTRYLHGNSLSADSKFTGDQSLAGSMKRSYSSVRPTPYLDRS